MLIFSQPHLRQSNSGFKDGAKIMVVVKRVDEQSLTEQRIRVIQGTKATKLAADGTISNPLFRENSAEVRDDHNVALQKNEDNSEVDTEPLLFSSSLDTHKITAQSPKRNGPIEELEEGLAIQKKRFGRLHGSITRTLHGLAIQYRVKGRYDKAISSLKEALLLLDERLSAVRRTEDKSDGKLKSSKIPKVEYHLENRVLEEMSALYSTLGRTYSMRFMYSEAMDYYLKSVNMLVEAKYSGDDPKVEMMVRVMKRTESNRISNVARDGSAREERN